MKNIEQVIKKITDRWFLAEPLLFSVYCTHTLTENDALSVPFRIVHKHIEYAPHILRTLDEACIEECLLIEVIRIVLKHPYQRRPVAANPAIMSMASNVTINDACSISSVARQFLHGCEFDLPEHQCYEEYYEQLKHLLQPFMTGGSATDTAKDESGIGEQAENAARMSRSFGSRNEDNRMASGKSDDENGDASDSQSGGGQSLNNNKMSDMQRILKQSYQNAAEWAEDDQMCIDINKAIEDAESTAQWGSLPRQLVDIIKASRLIEMDYRQVLMHFRTSVLSSRRYLTRMKPSRRYGFAAMGSRYALAANLLIAVDVSGSVTDKSLSDFFSVINRFFKYGIERIDVIQFDAELKNQTPLLMKKAKNEVKIIGRGGTDFQPAADYYCSHPEYDGLIYFTDGHAPMPTFNTKRPINVLWVLCGKSEYEKSKDSINAIRQNRATYIPNSER